jgi:hypothetical protein
MRGEKQAGLDPIGLEPDFPGLIASSVQAQGVKAGSVEPLAFASYNTFTYAVLTVDGNTLTVRVTGINAADPIALTAPAGQADYGSQEPQMILSFSIMAQ